MRSLHPWPIFPVNLDPPVARSLSIQFILQELLSYFERIAELQKVTPSLLVGANRTMEIALISDEIEKLLLFSLENSFSQKGGVLDKLCFYCEILVKASNICDQKILMLLEEMMNTILQTRSKMIGWKKIPTLHPIDEILSFLLDFYDDLQQKIRCFFKAFSPFLQEARSDENVLIFLIENLAKFNAFLGPRCIEDLLNRFFPAGHAQLRAVICEGYTRRGFASFFAKAEPLIDALEWGAYPFYLNITQED
jgi:hypothetical protein